MGRSAHIRAQRRRRARLSGTWAEWLASRRRRREATEARVAAYKPTPRPTRVPSAAERAHFRTMQYAVRKPD